MKKRNAFYQTSFDDKANATETPASLPNVTPDNVGDAIESFRAEFAFLSDFFEQAVAVEGIIYPTAEHAFQAMKVREETARYHIKEAPTPAAAKARGKRVALREDWETARFAEMEKVLRVKFADPKLRRRLVATGDRQLIEGNTWRDTTWGAIRDGMGAWKGRNELGKILMCLRDELRAENEKMAVNRMSDAEASGPPNPPLMGGLTRLRVMGAGNRLIITATPSDSPINGGGGAVNPPDTATAELIRIAQAARTHAYAPYSEYQVGAAVRTADGRIFFGCNVENASYGLTCCAERNAVFAAIAAGAREIVAVAVVTRDGGSPCGACRQVLSEFRPKDEIMQIYLVDETGNVVRETTIAELLPFAFELHEPKQG